MNGLLIIYNWSEKCQFDRGSGKSKKMDRRVREIDSDFNRFRSLSTGFTEFCQSTSIHGLRYLGNRDKKITLRFVWLIIIAMSFVGAGYIIYGSVQGKNTTYKGSFK